MEPFKNNMSPELVACIAQNLENHLDDFDRAAFEPRVKAEGDSQGTLLRPPASAVKGTKSDRRHQPLERRRRRPRPPVRTVSAPVPV
jgi:hypothetical protein